MEERLFNDSDKVKDEVNSICWLIHINWSNICTIHVGVTNCIKEVNCIYLNLK